MRINFILFTILVFQFPSLILAAPEASKTVVELDHPVMDAKDKMQGSKGVDVVKVTVKNDGTQLQTSALLHKEVKQYITDSAGRTLSIYLDTDNNSATGGEIPFCSMNGFERRIDLSICLDFGGGTYICGGGMGKKASSFLNGQNIYDYNSKKNSWEQKISEVKGPITSNQLDSSVSYQTLDIKPGTTIRISAQESDASFQKGCFAEAFLKLK